MITGDWLDDDYYIAPKFRGTSSRGFFEPPRSRRVAPPDLMPVSKDVASGTRVFLIRSFEGWPTGLIGTAVSPQGRTALMVRFDCRYGMTACIPLSHLRLA